jgi:propionyl-CoA carboxylase alpha chain
MNRIRTLLVANRGEIACRILRTAEAMGISTVAVFSDADADSPHVAQADVAVRLPGVAAVDTYLRADLIIEAALRTGADAIHPGYGFLSENASFAQQATDAKLIFVGPSPEVITAMGSKIRAKELMAAAGVPILPGATVCKDSELATLAERVGFPLLVKASAGGGGRGMRIVREPSSLVEAVAAARREAGSAFGDETVFLERYVVDPRHVEVQILGDRFGTVVHLFERDCSVQRRFQKVVEETPSPAVSAELRERLGAAATAAGRALGYVGAGTVEFVLDGAGQFHFLEVNTRLQVEHPVTELVTGLDLVRLQLLVAQGEPLPPEARTARMTGHAIEVRLYAEDPRNGFLPTAGRLRDFSLPDTVRVDAGVDTGQEISTHYDALLAKVVAHAPTRPEAAAVLATALRRGRVHGVGTNQDLLVGILSHREFLAGGADTGFLQRHPAAELMAAGSGRLEDAAAAATLALRAHRRREATVQAAVTPGWRNVLSADPLVRLQTVDGARVLDVRYRVVDDRVELRIDDQPFDPLLLAGVTPVGAHRYEVELERDGLRQSFVVGIHGQHLDVSSAAGPVELVAVDPLPPPSAPQEAGSLTAPMPGLVVRTEVEPGQRVARGQPVLVLEAMKMEHTVRSPHDGVVEAVLVAVGEQVAVGQLLAVLHGTADSEGAQA